MNILHVDSNHPLLIRTISSIRTYESRRLFQAQKKLIEAKIHSYDGLIIRSRFRIDADFLDKATNLKFIGRVGAGSGKY